MLLKRMVFILFTSVLLIDITSCGFNDTNSFELPNGIVIDKDTKDRLIAMEPDFRALLERKTIDARSLPVQNLPSEPIALLAGRELLLREFGEKGLDYIITGTYGEQVIEISPQHKGSKWIDDVGNDGAYVYYLQGTCQYLSMPWCSWAWADTDGIRKLIADGKTKYWATARLRAKITDEVTPSPGNVANAYNEDGYITANGNSKWGFFPPAPKNITTWHDIWDGVVTDGHAGAVLHWN
jgi:hypothetical protein